MIRMLVLSLFLLSTCAEQKTAAQEPNVYPDLSQHLALSKNRQQLDFSNGLRSVLEDSKGNIWFGSHNEGLCKYDGVQFIYYTQDDGLVDNQVRTIQEHIDGSLWFSTAHGVSTFDGGKFISYAAKDNLKYVNKDSWTWNIGSDDLFFNGGNFQGIFRYNGKEISYLPFPLADFNDKEWARLCTGVAKGKEGRLWVATYPGVIGYDGKRFTSINNKSQGYKEEGYYMHVRSIFEDSKGTLWVGNNGIGVLRGDGKEMVNFSEQQGLSNWNKMNISVLPQSNTLEHVFAINEDSKGDIWFGDRDTGAWCFDGQTMKNYTQNDGLTCSHIWQFYNAKNGELWLVMNDGAICKFNGKSFERIF